METKTAQPALSIVLPCLNEERTVGTCVDVALAALKEARIPGEVIVADNGSADRSITIAAQHGARVVEAQYLGYGSAIMAGVEAAAGEFVIMADCDMSYDLSQISQFYKQLISGAELVIGCRLPSGGGSIEKGAMPVLHRYVGTPFFSCLVRRWYNCNLHDINCGYRGFQKKFFDSLNLRCTGMEFASEMLVKAQLMQGKVVEIPITLSKDGRNGAKPHLRTFHDGWRHLRFMLMYTPKALFFKPGIIACALAVVAALTLMFANFSTTLNAALLGLASLLFICGFQAIIWGLLVETFAIRESLRPATAKMDRLYKFINLETGLLVGTFIGVLGFGLTAYALRGGLTESNYGVLVMAAAFLTLGFQVCLWSLFASILGLDRKQ